MSKHFRRLFIIALAIALTSSGVWGMSVYAAKIYTQNISNPSVSTNQIVTSSFIRNYTKGISIYASSSLTFTNDGGVNVNGGSFTMSNEVLFENNGTFTFTGTNNTFSLGNQGTFVNNGTATITNVYNFGIPSGASFVNNGTLHLENIAYPNLDGFVNNGIIIIPDNAKNSYLHLALEGKNGENGQVYTQSDYENRKLRYLINYELNSNGYTANNDQNPTTYEWAAADPQDVTLADPSLDGFEFLGWTGLDVTEPAKNFTFSSSICSDVTVTAHWQPIVYTIAYDLDGGSFSVGQTPPAEYTRGDQKAIPSPYKNGYMFNGWIDTNSNEQVSTADEKFFYMPPSTLGDKTYKASYIANSETRYKVICCYQNIDGITYEHETFLFTGETDTPVSVSGDTYAKEGFTFDAAYSGNVTSGEIKADNSLELKLYFTRNKYTVTFKSQDGSETLWTTEKYYDEKVGGYGGDIPLKVSDDDLYTYVFDNWSREEPNRDFGYDISDVAVSENITFYAAFEKVRDESVVIIKWQEYDGFNAPAQTEIRLARGADYTAQLQLTNENYYIGTKEWNLGFKEAHIYWYDPQSGEHGIDYTVDKENFEAPVTLTIPNVQHDTFITVKAHYHDEHDYSPAYDTIMQNGNCTADSIIRHFCYKCGKTYDETIPAGGHITNTAFETDAVSHWKTCTICNEVLGLETHAPDTGTVTHEPTHTSTGTKTYVCTVCGYVTGREVLPMVPHTPEGGWQSNAKVHYKICSCGEILEATPHIPDSGTVTLEPTYDTWGERVFSCTVCGYVLRTETIPALEEDSETPFEPAQPDTPSQPDKGMPFIKNENEKNG